MSYKISQSKIILSIFIHVMIFKGKYLTVCFSNKPIAHLLEKNTLVLLSIKVTKLTLIYLSLK